MVFASANRCCFANPPLPPSPPVQAGTGGAGAGARGPSKSPVAKLCCACLIDFGRWRSRLVGGCATHPVSKRAKVNFLNSLVFPQGYYDSSAVVPPFIRLTIGDLYKGKLSFIESLSHTWDDNTPWNVTNKERKVLSNDAGIITGTPENADIDMKGYRLPMITDVSMTVKFLIGRNNTSGRKFYSFEPQSK